MTSIGQRSRLGIGDEPGGRVAPELLGATTPRTLASAALQQVEARFGCRALRLVWEPGASSGGPLRHACPESAADGPEAALVEAAFAAGSD
ncbi:MAG: hypothetical protein ACRES8_03470, partial [Nevskiaceae bacterium]